MIFAATEIIDTVQAWATSIAVLVAVVAVWFEARSSRRAMGAETYYQLEEKFFHTDLMRALRRRAATELASGDSFDAFDDLADFFDFVGILVRRRVLDEEMAWSSFYRRAAAFWDEGLAKKVIERARKCQPLRWNEYEYLVRRLERVHARKGKLETGPLPTEERSVLLAQERRLPTIEQVA